MQVEILGTGNAVRILLPDASSIKLESLGLTLQKSVDFPSIVSLMVFR